jgi:hypothetical protein
VTRRRAREPGIEPARAAGDGDASDANDDAGIARRGVRIVRYGRRVVCSTRDVRRRASRERARAMVVSLLAAANTDGTREGVAWDSFVDFPVPTRRESAAVRRRVSVSSARRLPWRRSRLCPIRRTGSWRTWVRRPRRTGTGNSKSTSSSRISASTTAGTGETRTRPSRDVPTRNAREEPTHTRDARSPE